MGDIKFDEHCKEYYREAVRQWAASPFKVRETPQQWLKRNKRVTGYELNPHKLTVPPKNGSSYIYVLLSEGAFAFTGFGTTNTPDKRLEQHSATLGNAASKIAAIAWFEMTRDDAKFIEKAIKKSFPIISQPLPSFQTEATAAELYDQVVSFTKESLEQRKYFSELMSVPLEPVVLSLAVPAEPTPAARADVCEGACTPIPIIEEGLCLISKRPKKNLVGLGRTRPKQPSVHIAT